MEYAYKNTKEYFSERILPPAKTFKEDINADIDEEPELSVDIAQHGCLTTMTWKVKNNTGE